MDRLKWLQKPENAFLSFGLIAGLIFLVLTPPLQVADEPAHFLRSYQVSEGRFFAERTPNRVGGNVPLSLEKFCHPFWLMIFPGGRISFDSLGKMDRIALNPEVKKFKDFNNTALYPPVCYLPQAAGMFFFRVFEAPPFYIFYAGRLAAFLFWLFVVRYAIAIIPTGKWLLATLALLPMSLYTAISLSADSVTNAVCFLFVAMVIRGTVSVPDKKDLLRLVLAVVVLASVKPVYSALALLLLLLPVSAFGSRRKWFSGVMLLITLSVVTSIVWSKVLSYAYITYHAYDPAVRDDLSLVAGADMNAQLSFILHNVGAFLGVVGASAVHAFELYGVSFIGNFGWLSEPLPLWLVAAGYLAVVLVAVSDGNTILRPAQRVTMACVFLVCAFLLFVSQHLIWDPVGGSLISNLQGRYFIPLAPALFLAFGTRVKTARLAPLTFTVFTAAALSWSAAALYSKFFH